MSIVDRIVLKIYDFHKLGDCVVEGQLATSSAMIVDAGTMLLTRGPKNTTTKPDGYMYRERKKKEKKKKVPI